MFNLSVSSGSLASAVRVWSTRVSVDDLNLLSLTTLAEIACVTSWTLAAVLSHACTAVMTGRPTPSCIKHRIVIVTYITMQKFISPK